MSITAKTLINSQYAPNGDTTLYTVPANTRTIIDKFTATNTDSSTRTLNINIIPLAGSVGGSNLVMDAVSLTAGQNGDLTQMQNQILSAGDQLSVNASVASKVVIRVSGRECT